MKGGKGRERERESADKWEKQKVGEAAVGKQRITVADSPTGSGPG